MSLDLFISYAWRDNAAPEAVGVDPKVHRWVWMFRNALTKSMGYVLARDPQVWIDQREMRTNERVGDVLKAELQRSRLLLMLMSPNWLASEWCRRELEEFRRTHQGTATAESIFVVEIHPVQRTRWEHLVGVKGMTFYKPMGAGHVRYGHPLPTLTDTEYHDQVASLASEICDFLAASEVPAGGPPGGGHGGGGAMPVEADPVPGFNTGRAPDPAAGPGAPVALPGHTSVLPGPVSVWLADPAPELLHERRDLVEAVRQAGFGLVLPDQAALARLPQAEQRPAFQAGLARARLLVQMVGTQPGEETPDGRTWARWQADEAMAHARRSGAPYVRWRHPDARVEEVADTMHRELLTGAIRQGVVELRSEVLRQLRSLAAPPPPPAAAAGEGTDGPSICLSYSEDDVALVQEIQQVLDELQVEYLGFESPSRFVDAKTADSLCADEDKAIAGSTGVILVYGRAAREWLTTKIMRANQLRGRTRRPWGALIDAPMPSKAPAPIASSIRRLDWSADTRVALMKAFLDTLRVSAHG